VPPALSNVLQTIAVELVYGDLRFHAPELQRLARASVEHDPVVPLPTGEREFGTAMRHDEDLAEARQIFVLAELFAAIVVFGGRTRYLDEQNGIDDCQRVVRRALCLPADDRRIRIRRSR